MVGGRGIGGGFRCCSEFFRDGGRKKLDEGISFKDNLFAEHGMVKYPLGDRYETRT